MEKSYLYKRHNVYWVRVRVPDKVRDIVGKAQFSKNLSTTDLSEINLEPEILHWHIFVSLNTSAQPCPRKSSYGLPMFPS